MKPNKKRAEKQRTRSDSLHSAQHHSSPATTTAPWGRSSSFTAAAAEAAAGDSQQQQHSVAAVDSSLQQRTEQSTTTTTPAALAAAEKRTTTKTATQHKQHHLQQQQPSARETQASKQRKVWLSTRNITLAFPGGIPQVDGGDGLPDTPNRSVTPPFKDPPTPPPMSHYLPSDPDRVICHLCFENVHYIMYVRPVRILSLPSKVHLYKNVIFYLS